MAHGDKFAVQRKNFKDQDGKTVYNLSVEYEPAMKAVPLIIFLVVQNLLALNLAFMWLYLRQKIPFYWCLS